MYQHIISHQHQVLPSPKERDSPHRSPSALITSWPEPAAATGALQHPVTSPAPQNTLFPPSSTPRMSAGVRGTRGHGREGAANPPSLLHPFPRFHRATHGLASLLPPGRRDTARRRFPTRPGAELRSPAPKDEPPVDSDLAGAVGGRSGAGARAARRGTPRRRPR